MGKGELAVGEGMGPRIREDTEEGREGRRSGWVRWGGEILRCAALRSE